MDYKGEFAGPAQRLVDQLRVARMRDDRLLGRRSGSPATTSRPSRSRSPPTTASSGSACTAWRSASVPRTSRRFGSCRSSGFRYEGLRRRYIHINGDWRDHFCFALTVDELPQGVLRRWLDGLAPEADAAVPAADRAKAAIPLRTVASPLTRFAGQPAGSLHRVVEGAREFRRGWSSSSATNEHAYRDPQPRGDPGFRDMPLVPLVPWDSRASTAASWWHLPRACGWST